MGDPGGPSLERAAREEVTRTVATQHGLLRRGSAAAVLALLSASALVPVAVAVAGGGAVATALAGVAGNMGSGYLAGVIERSAARLRRRNAGSPGSGAVRDALAAELLVALEKGDSTAHELGAALTQVLVKIDGFETAIDAAQDDLRTHLVGCFTELTEQQHAALEKLDAMGAEQQRHGKELRSQKEFLEETVDRLRYVMSSLAERSSPQQPPAPSGGVQRAIVPIVVAPTATAAVPGASPWYGGVDVAIGDRVYLIHSDFLEEHFSADRSLLRRQARGLQLVPTHRAGNGYAWLRQVEAHRVTPATSIALQTMTREHDLLVSLRSVRELPGVNQLAADGRTATLVTVWPASRSTGGPCETLEVALGRDGAPIDPWHMFRLFNGLAGLCSTLARLHAQGVVHRYLTPAGIIVLDNGRLVLRDLGLAARDHEPGEGPADYQAPEQRRRGDRHSGPHTDVYQLAAVAYHLIAGRPPVAGTPLPVQAQAPDVPERISRALDAALKPAPTERPSIRSLGATLRAARDDLS